MLAGDRVTDSSQHPHLAFQPQNRPSAGGNAASTHRLDRVMRLDPKKQKDPTLNVDVPELFSGTSAVNERLVIFDVCPDQDRM